MPRETRALFSPLVKDLFSLALTEKKGAIEGLFVLPRLILPTNNMRDRAVVSKVLQNIRLFRKGMFKEQWNMPNVVLRYGSFNPIKRVEALARAVRRRTYHNKTEPTRVKRRTTGTENLKGKKQPT